MKNKKLKNLGNLKLRTRTKVLIPVLIALILLCSAIPLADIDYKYGGGYEGAIDVIRNSNSKVWEATGANVLTAVWDLNNTGGVVNFPSGTTITMNRGFKPPKNTTIYFNGCRLLLDDLGVEKAYMINMYNDNVTLVDPWLDMDRANNEVNGASGNQIAIYFNGNSHNCEIIGGLIENACQSGIGGASHGLTISGTKILDPGEHGFYFSSNSSKISAVNVDVIEPGINNTRRGYGFKFDNVESCVIDNCYVEYTGYESFPGDNSIGVVIGSGSRSVKVHGRVVNAEYGIYAGASSYNGRPCENIDISLTCEGCKNFAYASTPSNLIGCHVYDSYMDLGVFRLDAFGDSAVTQRLTMNNTGASNLTTSCYLTAESQNVSFTLKDSFIRGSGSYIVNIQTGHDLVIENNVIINDNVSANNYCCLRLSDVTGNIRVDDNTFKGGSHWSLRYDSANENFLCSGNRFTEPYNGDTPGTAIEWIKEPTKKYMQGNVNLSDNLYLPADTTTPYSAAFAGAVWINTTGNGELGICFDGTNYKWFNYTRDTDTHLTQEEVEDYVGGMLDGTETHITVSYDDDGGNNIDFVVSDDWWDAVGDITDDTITEAKLEIDNAPVDEYSLTWEQDTGEMHWQDVSGGGGSGYHNNSLIWNSDNNSWLPTYANIQNAIDDCGDYGWVKVPEGTFNGTVDLEMDDRIDLIGAGREITIIRGADAAEFGSDPIIKCWDIHNWSISHLTVDGNIGGITTGGSCINVQNSQDFSIYDVWCHHPKGTALNIRGDDIGDGNVRGHLYDLWLSNVVSTSHCLTVLWTNDSWFDGITTWDAASDWGVDFSKCNNNTIENILIYDSSYGMKLTGTAYTYGDYSSFNVLDNIVIRDIDTTADHACLKITYAKYNTLTNLVLEGASRGLDLDGSYNIISGVQITDCYYSIFNLGDNYDISNVKTSRSRGKGLSTLNADNNTYTNCHFDYQEDESTVTTCDHTKFVSCSFSHATDANGLDLIDTTFTKIFMTDFIGNFAVGLDLANGAANSNYTIMLCDFINNGGDGVTCHASDDWIRITHNTFIGDVLTDHFTSKGLVEKNFGDDI